MPAPDVEPPEVAAPDVDAELEPTALALAVVAPELVPDAADEAAAEVLDADCPVAAADVADAAVVVAAPAETEEDEEDDEAEVVLVEPLAQAARKSEGRSRVSTRMRRSVGERRARDKRRAHGDLPPTSTSTWLVAPSEAARQRAPKRMGSFDLEGPPAYSARRDPDAGASDVARGVSEFHALNRTDWPVISRSR